MSVQSFDAAKTRASAVSTLLKAQLKQKQLEDQLGQFKLDCSTVDVLLNDKWPLATQLVQGLNDLKSILSENLIDTGAAIAGSAFPYKGQQEVSAMVQITHNMSLIAREITEKIANFEEARDAETLEQLKNRIAEILQNCQAASGNLESYIQTALKVFFIS